MLEINGLVKHYGDFTLNCTMKVEPGRITGLVGENGAGKRGKQDHQAGICRFRR